MTGYAERQWYAGNGIKDTGDQVPTTPCIHSTHVHLTCVCSGSWCALKSMVSPRGSPLPYRSMALFCWGSEDIPQQAPPCCFLTLYTFWQWGQTKTSLTLGWLETMLDPDMLPQDLNTGIWLAAHASNTCLMPSFQAFSCWAKSFPQCQGFVALATRVTGALVDIHVAPASGDLSWRPGGR